MTPEILSSLLAGVLSLATAYIPGYSDWYAALSGPHKRLLMAGGLILIAAGCMVIACAGYAEAVGVPLTCDQAGGIVLVRCLLAALVANQATYSLLVRPRGDTQ